MSLRSRFGAAAAEPDTRIGPHGETALHLAAKAGDAAEVQKIIDAGASAFILDNYNTSPLIYAAQSGDAATVKAVAAATKQGLDYASSPGTALGIAAQNGNVAAMAALIDAGANMNVADDMGATPLMNAVYAGHYDAVEYLLKRGADTNILRGGEGVLHLAARNSEPGIMALLLKYDAGKHINQPTATRGMAPLHLAVLTGNTRAAEDLIDAGALMDIENTLRQTPAIQAAMQGNVPMLRILVEKGHADLRVATGDDKMNALHRATWDAKREVVKELVRLGADPLAQDGEGRSAPEIAAQKNWRDIAEYFFAEWKQPANIIADAIYASVMNDKEDMTRYLLGADGFDINQRARNGRTVLSAAVEQYDIHLVQRLLSLQADPNIGDAQSGETPLHLAARRGRSTIGETLLKAGANPLQKDKSGRTALDLAREAKHTEMVKLLEQAEKDYVTPKSFPKSGIPSP